MKKYLFIFYLTIFSIFEAFAQNPAIFDTWDLYGIEIKFSPTVLISDIEPPISPVLTINENLSFNGFGACNSFSGTFEYLVSQDRLEPISYMDTTIDCATEFLDAIEDEYFGYFEAIPPALFYDFYLDIDGLEHLLLSRGYPGFQLDFIRSSLSVPENHLIDARIYPNPVSETLFITSENITIETITIFDLNGRQILKTTGESQIDLYSLVWGVYFIEIGTAEGKSIQKFIKK